LMIQPELAEATPVIFLSGTCSSQT